MSRLHDIFSIAAILCMLGLTASAATGQYGTKTPFPQQGLIQGVPNYSSNPFWNPNSQYNQRMPTPVYVQGTDLDTADCQQVVAALVASFCNTRNNCRDTALDDARPTITIQLASLPNYNYVGSCAGYIDSEFASYKSKYSNAAVTNGTVAFPTATTPNPNVNAPEFEMQNPYKSQLPSFYNDQWGQEILERKQELQNLQSANDADNEQLVRANFPASTADVSFINRMRNEAAGYAPYADKSAYEPLNIESEETYLQRIGDIAAAQTPSSPGNDPIPPTLGGGGGGGGGGGTNPEEALCENTPLLKDCLSKIEPTLVDSKALPDEPAIIRDRNAYLATIGKTFMENPDNLCLQNLGVIVKEKPNMCINIPKADGTKYKFTFTSGELFTNMPFRIGYFFSTRNDLILAKSLLSAGDLPTDEWWSDDCSDHTIWDNIDDDADVNRAGGKVFGSTRAKDEYYIDFPSDTRIFPGLMVTQRPTFGGSKSDLLLYDVNYSTAVEHATTLQSSIQGMHHCNGLYLYLIALDPVAVDSTINVISSATTARSTHVPNVLVISDALPL